MAADITPFIIRIQTALEKGGIEGAKTELAALTAETDKSKKANEGAAGSSDKLGQSVGKAAELTGSLTAAMASGGPEAQQLGAGLRVLKALVEGSTAGFMGLATVMVGAGVSAYVAWHNKVEESKKKLAEFRLQLQDNAREMQMSKLSDYAADIDKVRTALDNEADAYNRLSAARATMDSAEKGSRLADITLKEKQAQFALKPGDQVGAAKVAAQFAGQRRDLDTEYQIKDAKRAAEDKDHALYVEQEKLALTEKKLSELAKEMERVKEKVLNLSQEKVDLFGSKTPMREQVETRMGPGGIPIEVGRSMVVDEEKRKQRIAQIDNELNGSKDAPGLTENFGKMSESFAAIVIQKAKAKIEVEAKQMEADAALKNLSTANSMSPRINAADKALEQKNIGAITATEKQESAQRVLSRSDANRAVLASERNLRTARNQGADNSSIEAIKAELDKALQARAEADRVIIENARAQASQSNATAAAIKDIKAQQARPGSGG